MIVFAALVPHPPFSVPGIGTAKEKARMEKTLRAIEELRVDLERSQPDTVIIISPHALMEEYHFVVNSANVLEGDYGEFGLRKKMKFENDSEIFRGIEYSCEMIEMFLHKHPSKLDYGALIPLDHLLKNIQPRVVHLSFSLLSYDKHYEYGALISNTLRATPKRIAVIASGELSHRLAPGSPAGYSPSAKLFDYWILEHLASNDFKALIDMEKEVVEDAAECGLRSILVMLGCIYQEKYEFNLLSYESPFGVGYLTARFI